MLWLVGTLAIRMNLPVDISGLKCLPTTDSTTVASTMESSSATLIIGGLFVCIALFYLPRIRRSSLPYPPGPSGYPLIGYLKVIQDPIWKTFRDWGRAYGELSVH